MLSEKQTDYIAEAIDEAFGQRCSEYAEGCACCEAWAQYDALTAAAQAKHTEASMSVEELVKEAHKVAQWNDSPSQILLELADKLEELADALAHANHMQRLTQDARNKAEAALAEAKRENEELRLTIKKIADIKPTSSADHDSIARSWMRDIALSKVLEFTRNAGGKDAE